MVLDGVQSCGFEHGNVKDWVYSFHSIGESESEGVGFWLHNNLKRSEVLFGELFRRSGGAEKLSFDEGLAPNFEVWSQSSLNVSGLLISPLSVRFTMSASNSRIFMSILMGKLMRFLTCESKSKHQSVFLSLSLS